MAVVLLGLMLAGGRPGTQGGRMRVLLGVLLVCAIAAAALLKPAVFSAVVYGCEPGMMALAALLLMQWLMHERYRRQVFFLPSFSRIRSESSQVRAGGMARPTGEPSTVDHPRADGGVASGS
jgi:hypothetical protein